MVEYREFIARTRKKSYQEWEYWGKPVTGFGDINGSVLILGLAPGAHGSNRTGRMFTGDASGNFLYPVLYSAGFANQPNAISIDDGLELKDIFISAVCRCVPPDNKPGNDEILNCREYLLSELNLIRNIKGIVALGKIAFESSLALLKQEFGNEYENKPQFEHGRFFRSNHKISTPWLLASYHPSRQNTQTGRLTKEMFQEIWDQVRGLIDSY